MYIYLPFIKLSWFKNTIKIYFLGYFTSLLIEIIGVNSGYPFGRYYYTSLLGPRIYGVPYAIPLFGFQLFILQELQVILDCIRYHF
ncbi:carotenoid biosynthesis protein [Acidiplasma cupricumulans]|uniref:carotenoid biosynthesis protein n=1 Tax=Acidiplasma cupricumulans TaxID=312540 RepID=UPI0015845800|nr:carotenoid biosynthesis protein [Acidiplasma cupricumulans]